MRSNSEIIDLIIMEKDKKGLSLSELARRVGIAKSALSRYFNKTREFPLNRLQTFADVLDLSSEYLLGIEDKDNNINNETVSKIVKISNKLTKLQQEKVYYYASELLHSKSENIIKENKELYKIQTLNSLSAGLGYSYDDERDIYYTDRDDLKPYDLATVVSGDSMIPYYQDGDVVLIQSGYDNVHGAVYAVDYDGKSYLKRVFFEGNRIRLVSYNENYSDIYIPLPLDGVYLNIIGKVVDSFKPINN